MSESITPSSFTIFFLQQTDEKQQKNYWVIHRICKEAEMKKIERIAKQINIELCMTNIGSNT